MMMFHRKSTFIFTVGLQLVFNVAFAKPITSRHEFFWAVSHPFAAIKVNSIYKKLKPYYNEKELTLSLDAYSSGGKLDAFRHVFYMAAFAQKVKAKKIIKLGKAHEKTNYLQFKRGKLENEIIPDSMSCVMDLKNNEIGVALGKENKKLSLVELKLTVIALIQKGDAFYFSIDSQGRFLDCQNNVVNVAEYKGKWFVPKCLLGLKAVNVSE